MEIADKSILIRRKMALGDVILITPIIKKIKEILPKSSVSVSTDIHDVLKNNPYVDFILPTNTPLLGYDKVYNLDLVYERNPSEHIITSYAKFVFGEDIEEKSTQIYPLQSDEDIIEKQLKDFGIFNNNFIVFHMGVTARNRTWAKENWSKLIQNLTHTGCPIIIIGKNSDFFISGLNVFNLINKLSVQQVHCLIKRSKCFVGNDSGMLHVAGTTETPIVGIFTSAMGEYRMPYRQGVFCHNAKIVKPDLDCYGCLEKEIPPVECCGCRRGDYACVLNITPENVYNAIVSFL